jgi:AraC-like DNA-binding protein
MVSMHRGAAPRLERSCTDWMRIAPASGGIERIEAFFCGHGFDPHRHDTYAIGITIAGVQAFRYRGAARRSLPGQVFVLHPDETHDGRAGTAAGFRYRILYLEPRLIGAALGHGPLPFWREAVAQNARLAAAIVPALEDLDVPLEELQRDAIVLDLAEALAAETPRPALRHHDIRAVRLAREFLDAHEHATSAELEAITGMTRYAMARHFRSSLGTSPYRYLLMRRLARARNLIRAGAPLADAALRCGFADQSHMTRQFKKAYGLSPGRFAALALGGA